MKNYRKQPEVFVMDELDQEDTVVLKEEYDTVIDDIEKKVNNALKKIEGITGIECIDECKEILERLSSDLY